MRRADIVVERHLEVEIVGVRAPSTSADLTDALSRSQMRFDADIEPPGLSADAGPRDERHPERVMDTIAKFRVLDSRTSVDESQRELRMCAKLFDGW